MAGTLSMTSFSKIWQCLVHFMASMQHCRVLLSKTTSSFDEIPTQKQKEESNQRSKNQQALLATRERIGTQPISLILSKPGNLLCLGLESGPLSATDGAIPVVWQLLHHKAQQGSDLTPPAFRLQQHMPSPCYDAPKDFVGRAPGICVGK